MTAYIPSDRELEALKVLWQNERATVREICDAISRGGDDLAYTTVLSLLQVMEQKGLVSHERVGKAYVYLPKVQRAPTFRTIASTLLHKVFDGAVDEYLIHALDSRSISNEELQKLEQLLASAKKNPRKRKG